MNYLLREELENLTEDELSILWYALNRIHPPLFEHRDVNYIFFTSIKKHMLLNKLLSVEKELVEEGKVVYTSLLNKIKARSKE